MDFGKNLDDPLAVMGGGASPYMKDLAEKLALVKNEILLINIGSTATGGRVLAVKNDLAKIQLTNPACAEIGEKVALSRRVEKHWRLVGECVPVVISRS